MVIIGLLAASGAGYFVWESKKRAEVEEKARIEQEAQLQHERKAQAQREAEAGARQEQLERELREKEAAIRLANEETARKEAEAQAAAERARLEHEAVLGREREAALQRQREGGQRALQQMLGNARTCLDRRNFSCAITNADNVLSLDPGNKSARDLKRLAEDMQNKATANIRIE
jgi:membrane protein involved in colicin uptake